MATKTFDAWGISPDNRVGYTSPPNLTVYSVTERMVTFVEDGVEPSTGPDTYWVDLSDPNYPLYRKVS